MFSLENNFILNPKSLSELYLFQANRPQIPAHISTLLLQNRLLSQLAKRPYDHSIPAHFLPSTKKTKTEKVQVLISNPDLKETQLDSLLASMTSVERLESSSSIKADMIPQTSPTEPKPSSKKIASISTKTEFVQEMTPVKKVEADQKGEVSEKPKPKKDVTKDPKAMKQEEEREIYELTERYNALISDMRSSGKLKKKDVRKSSKKVKKIEEDDTDDGFSTIGTENSKESE